MFLHLGKKIVIPVKDIIAVIDAESSFNSKDTRDFINIAEEEGFIYKIVDDNIKSYIITEKVERDKEGHDIRKSIIYCSNISSTTLCKRTSYLTNK